MSRQNGNEEESHDNTSISLKSKKRKMYQSDLEINYNHLENQGSSANSFRYSQEFLDEDVDLRNFNVGNNLNMIIKGGSLPHLDQVILVNNDDAVDESDDDVKDQLFFRQSKNNALKICLREKYYKNALLLVKNDAEFPKNFQFKDIDLKVESGVKLMDYLRKRNALHLFIKYAPHRITKMKFVKNLKFHLNLENESALYTAVINKKFKAYAFLKSIGAEFRNGEEGKKAKKNLDREELRNLDDINFSHLQRVEKPHLKNLIIKSTGSYCYDFEQKVTSYYTELDQIPEISTIFKVLQFTDNLTVAFNFNGKDVCDIVATSPYDIRGLTDGVKGRVCIGANRKREKILGHLAHELTHMAMHIVYENEANPYEFELINNEEQQNFNDLVVRLKATLDIRSTEPVEEVLLDVFFDETYNELDAHSELIARVPHILAQFPHGREWLEANAGELFEYFKKVILDCEEFIKNGTIHRKIKHLNESQGELNRVKEIGYALRFRNISENLSRYLKTEKNPGIYVIETENVLCTTLRALGVFYGKNYTKPKEYFIFKCERLILNYKKIFYLAQIPGVVKLIVVQVVNYIDSLMDRALGILLKLLQERPSLKVIFVMKEGGAELTGKLSSRVGLPTFLSIFDDQFSLKDLEDESGKILMGCEVIYQGKVLKMYELVGKNQDLVNLMGLDEVVKLLDHEDGEVLNFDAVVMKADRLNKALKKGEAFVSGSRKKLARKKKSKK